jgi:hypothetical protein
MEDGWCCKVSKINWRVCQGTDFGLHDNMIQHKFIHEQTISDKIVSRLDNGCDHWICWNAPFTQMWRSFIHDEVRSTDALSLRIPQKKTCKRGRFNIFNDHTHYLNAKQSYLKLFVRPVCKSNQLCWSVNVNIFLKCKKFLAYLLSHPAVDIINRHPRDCKSRRIFSLGILPGIGLNLLNIYRLPVVPQKKTCKRGRFNIFNDHTHYLNAKQSYLKLFVHG